jgi:hypothetical protein
MLRLALPTALLAAAALPAAAGAATYDVTVSHASTAVKADAEFRGTSAAQWQTARRGRLLVQGTSGLAELPVRGVFAADAASRSGSCSLRAPTGSDEFAAVAPESVTVTVSPDLRGGTKKLLVTVQGQRATLSNPYFGTPCTTSVRGEPKPEVTSSKLVSRAMLRRRKVTLKLAGRTAEDGLETRWRTVVRMSLR